ncbi:hypothetical protein C1T17_15860 [Sphingobium sp. SCG-1]|nr:hypothetical protein C1T17_15860 [Sphingobium sp. SCG-1]
MEASRVPNGGAYTSVGTYPFEEMVSLMTTTVKLTDMKMPELMESFGTFCFGQWVSYAPARVANKDLFDVLERVDDFHEQEVRKLYPDAELPSFKVESRSDTRLVLAYHSCKPLADLACGVIKGASVHLASPVSVQHSPQSMPGGSYVRFEIERVG